MDNYKKIIDVFVDAFDSAEEHNINMEVVLDARLAYDLACELEYLAKPFFIEENDQFERDLEENDILGVSLSVYEDGEAQYFLQTVLAEDGDTLMDDVVELLFVQDNLLDVIDLEKFESVKDVYGLAAIDDAEEEITYELDDECEEELEDIVEDIFDLIVEADEEGECPHCLVKDYLRELLN